MTSLLSGTLSARKRLDELGFDSYQWQDKILYPSLKWKLLLTCRQAGKSTAVAAKVEPVCRFEPGSDALIVCPAQDQSKEVMHKVADFINLRDDPYLTGDAVYEKVWKNRSRVMALPGSERSVRGYSDPRFIIFDEAARIGDATYNAAIPMTAAGVTEVLALSTPWGKRGWFYRAWHDQSGTWDKVMVTVRWRLAPDEMSLVQGPPEDEMQDYYAKRGVSFYYSERHTKAFCERMLGEIGPLWYRQEYQCEFIDLVTGVFTDSVVQQAVDPGAEMLDIGGTMVDDSAEVL